ncbi:MAG: hypothetical protein WCX65_16050, partial [bacterium]
AAADEILRELEFSAGDRAAVSFAISNHEAFRPAAVAETEDTQLISDALYDADKFRWGPDNFTETVWFMLEAAGAPVEMMVASYPEKIKGVEAVMETFRTKTGREYGPDFITRGLRIGEKMIEILNEELRRGGA